MRQRGGKHYVGGDKMEKICYSFRPSWGPRQKKGFMVVELRCIGQRYVSMLLDEKILEPEYVFAVRDLKWLPSFGGALRFIKKNEKGQTILNSLRHPTFTSSIGGPGYFPLSKEAGPLFAVVAEPPSWIQTELPSDLFPIKSS